MAKGPMPVYYFDACVFIDLIETPADQEPAKTIAARMHRIGQLSAWRRKYR
jgi:hypothetical protein